MTTPSPPPPAPGWGAPEPMPGMPAPPAVAARPKPWTPRDEERRAKLVDELRELTDRRGEAVAKVASVFGSVPPTTDAYIRNADAIRDALAPFDSGVRLANAA